MPLRRGRAALFALPLVLALLAVMPATATPTEGSERGGPALTVSVARPLPGEKFTVSGSVGQKRTVQLQSRSRTGAWRIMARRSAAPSGAFRFSTSIPARRTLRVVAPRSGRLKPVVTRSRVVTTSRIASTLSLSGDHRSIEARAVVSPARVGRSVVLETQSAGDWATVASGRQTASGVSTFVLEGVPWGSRSYRVRLAPWRGAPGHTGRPMTFAPVTPTWAVPGAVQDLVIDTEAAAPVESKDAYVDATMALDGAQVPLRIKGRGNSTWNWPKKPYRLKLDAAASLLGMPSEKDWVLLANHGDPSLLRNWLAFQLANQTRLEWNPTGRFVDLTLNGEELGSYLLVEQVEQSAARVDLPDDGLLLEIDDRFDGAGDPGVRTSRNTPLGFKDPDELTEGQVSELLATVEEFEDVLYGEGFADPATGYTSYVDVATFVDWYLVEELFKNLDGDFQSSVFVTWTPLDGLAMGPVWDFDLSSGFLYWDEAEAYRSPTGWWVRGGGVAGEAPEDHPFHDTHWIARMFADPAFESLVRARWQELAPVVTDLIRQIPAITEVLADSAVADREQWPEAPWYGMSHADDHAGEVDYLATWLSSRVAWMDGQLG